MKVLLLTVVVLLMITGCGKDAESPTELEQQYHAFTIYNSTLYAPKQLTNLEVIPVNGGTALTEDFVCNVGIERDVKISIPATGMFKVKILAADGQSMWWNSVGLELPGHSYLRVTCGGSPIYFWGECADLPPSGTNMQE
jgi:hypothetical protein